MKSSTKDLILKIVGYLLFIIVILILVKYIIVLNNNKNNNHSSQTINTIEKDNQIIHTQINNPPAIKSIKDEQERLILDITKKIKAEMIEKFTSDEICINDPTKSIYYLYLQVQLLEGVNFKPEPIWTNDLFCLYRVKPLISLDASVVPINSTEKDLYYPLGDILLFKDYRKYMDDYQNLLANFNDVRTVHKCEIDSNNQTESNNPIESNNPTESNNQAAPALQKNSNEGFIGKGTGVKGVVPQPDIHITNYDQPGLKGLQVLVKNGRKPVGFESEPVSVINGTNGENLYFWRPLAPEGYAFLGDMISMGVTPNMPMIDSCNIRCIPQECLNIVNLQEKSIVASKDINRPYKITTVANGKYFKGFIDNGVTTNTIISYDLNQKCLNVERDSNDTETKLDIVMGATDGSGNLPIRQLTEVVFNLILRDYLVEIEKQIVLNDELKLNNVLNNQNIDGSIFKKENMRFEQETKFLFPNKFTLSLIFKKRAIAYGEPQTKAITEIMKNKLNEILTYNFRGMGYDFTFIPENIIVINMGMSPDKKELLSKLDKVIKEAEKQVSKEKKTPTLSKGTLDKLDKLLTESSNLAKEINKNSNLFRKEIKDLITKCLNLIDDINKLISNDNLYKELVGVLKSLKSILNALKSLPDEVSNPTIDTDYNIDDRLKNELEKLASLALRTGHPAELDDFFHYNPYHLTKDFSITELKKKEN